MGVKAKGFSAQRAPYVILLLLISVLALVLRLTGFDYISSDYTHFLTRWVSEFRAGGFSALSTTSSNYNLAYLYFLLLFSYIPINALYLIKLLSVVFDFVLAFTVMRITIRISRDMDKGRGRYRALLAFALVLLWPSFLLNSAVWGQCDSIYVSFCLLSFLAALDGKSLRAVLLGGLAFAFKLQAVFFLPILGIFILLRRVKLWHAFVFFFIPHSLLAVPALFAGWSFWRTFEVYIEQVGMYSNKLTLNAPTFFAFGPHWKVYPYFGLGLISTMAFLGVFLVLTLKYRAKITSETLISFALALTVGVTWLLPSMHERYFYLAEVFVILFMALRISRRWLAVVLLASGVLVGYYSFLILDAPSQNLRLAAGAVLFVLLWAIYVSIRGVVSDVSSDKTLMLVRKEWDLADQSHITVIYDKLVCKINSWRWGRLRNHRSPLIKCFNSFVKESFGFEMRGQQIKAALQMVNKGRIIQMHTGEGKTIVAGLAAFLAASAGHKVHVVTVNEYLAKRDYEQFRGFLESQGLSVALNTRNADKFYVYSCDIVYTPVQDLLFDYVGSEFAEDSFDIPFDFAILDEIDYVLLDNANSRFTVSLGGAVRAVDSRLLRMVWLVSQQLNGIEVHYWSYMCEEYDKEQELVSEYDFYYNIGKRLLSITQRGYERFESLLGIMPEAVEYVNVTTYLLYALQARYLYREGVDYIAHGEAAGIISRANGRACANSFFDTEVDFFIRQKEGVRDLWDLGGQSNSVSSPIFFRKYKTAVGLSGTAYLAQHELNLLLGSGCIKIQSEHRKKCKEYKKHFATKHEKYDNIVRYVREYGERHAYLVICENEIEARGAWEYLRSELGSMLSESRISLLVNDTLASEVELIAQARVGGNILVSTNLVGRGVDIQVTEGVDYGLAVFMLYKGLDIREALQIRGRTARNGVFGVVHTLLSDEDEKNDGFSLENQRALYLCEDILLDNARRAIIDWVDSWRTLSDDEMRERLIGLFHVDFISQFSLEVDFGDILYAKLDEYYVEHWLDFRKSLIGRIMFTAATGVISERLHEAGERLKSELQLLIRDMLFRILVECFMPQSTSVEQNS